MLTQFRQIANWLRSFHVRRQPTQQETMSDSDNDNDNDNNGSGSGSGSATTVVVRPPPSHNSHVPTRNHRGAFAVPPPTRRTPRTSQILTVLASIDASESDHHEIDGGEGKHVDVVVHNGTLTECAVLNLLSDNVWFPLMQSFPRSLLHWVNEIAVRDLLGVQRAMWQTKQQGLLSILPSYSSSLSSPSCPFSPFPPSSFSGSSTDRKEEARDDCYICLEPLFSLHPCKNCKNGHTSHSSPRSIVETPCAHMFHRACLKQWLLMKGNAATCPTCRAGPIRGVYYPLWRKVGDGPVQKQKKKTEQGGGNSKKVGKEDDGGLENVDEDSNDERHASALGASGAGMDSGEGKYAGGMLLFAYYTPRGWNVLTLRFLTPAGDYGSGGGGGGGGGGGKWSIVHVQLGTAVYEGVVSTLGVRRISEVAWRTGNVV